MENEKKLNKVELKDDELEEISGGCWATAADVNAINSCMEGFRQKYGRTSAQYQGGQTVMNMLEKDSTPHTFQDFKRAMSMFFGIQI